MCIRDRFGTLSGYSNGGVAEAFSVVVESVITNGDVDIAFCIAVESAIANGDVSIHVVLRKNIIDAVYKWIVTI